MADLTIKLLGSFRASLDDAELKFPTDKIRALLAYLASNLGKSHRREYLAGLLWPDWPDDMAKRHLRQGIYRLKQTLDTASPKISDALLDISRQTITLNPKRVTVDVQQFKSLVAGGEIAALAQAANHYQGALLSGFSLPDATTFDEWLTLERESLEREAMQIFQSLATHHLKNGEYQQAQIYAHRQIESNRFQEEAHRQLMHALAASNKRSEALACFDQLKRQLKKELGVAPAEETIDLVRQIKAGELFQTAKKAATAPPEIPNDELAPIASLHNFPIQNTAFIGRAHELYRALEVIENPDMRLLTISGVGGIGKTRFAVEAAQRAFSQSNAHVDGAYFISLVDAGSDELLIPTIANQIGVTLKQDDALKEYLYAFLRDKKIILLLDNLEGLQAGADVCSEILTHAPDVMIVVTSRGPLNLSAESRLPLGGLSYPDQDTSDQDVADDSAVQLFIETATRIHPGFSTAPQQISAIHEICQLVKGLPLAIEIAATWVRLYDCTTIAKEISRNLDFLITPLRDIPERHRSMRAVFEHTWDLLPPDQQKALGQIFVFEGDFNLETVQMIMNISVLEMAALLDKSLLQKTRGERFIYNDLLRQFILEQHTNTKENTRSHEKHAAYFLGYLKVRVPDLEAGYQKDALDEVGLELKNILAAWEWGVLKKNIVLLESSYLGLFHFFDTRSRFREGELIFDQAIRFLEEVVKGTDAYPFIAQLRARLAWFRFHLGKIDESIALFEQSLDVLEAFAPGASSIFSHNYLGAVYRHIEVYEKATQHLVQARALAEKHDNPHGKSIALNILGQLASLQGQNKKARKLCEEALAIKREIGDQWGMTFSLTYLGRVAQQLGEHEEACQLFEESLSLSEEFRDRRGVAFSLHNLGNSAAALGDTKQARAYYEKSIALYESIGSHKDAEHTKELIVKIDA